MNLDPRPELPGSPEWDKLLRKALMHPPPLYERLWICRSAGAVIESGRILPGLWTQEDWEEIAKPRLKEYAAEIKNLMEGMTWNQN